VLKARRGDTVGEKRKGRTCVLFFLAYKKEKKRALRAESVKVA
jgi:hypothetical protein